MALTPEKIAVLDAYFGNQQAQPASPQLDEGTRTGGRIARDFLTGVSSVADIPQILITRPLAAVGQKAANLFGANELEQQLNEYRTAPLPSEMVEGKIDEYTQNTLQPQNAVERIVDSGVRAASGGVAMGPTKLGVKGISDLGAAIGGGLGAQATAEVTDNPIAQIVGGLAGGVAGAGKTTPKAPSLSSQSSKNLAKEAIQEGIPLRQSQVKDNRFGKTIASVTNTVPFSGAKSFAEKQVSAYNKAVLRKAGIDSDIATPEVLAQAQEDFGKRFSDASARTTLKVDDNLLNDLGNIEQEAAKRLGNDGQKMIRSYIDDVLNSGGKIAGEVYQNTRSKLGQLANSNNDPFIAGLLKDTQVALDDAAFRSLSSGDKKEWLKVRKEYSAFKTIQKAMNSTSEHAAVGNITPGALATAVKTGNKNFSSGAGELNKLARIGSRFVKDSIPNSGSPERIAAYSTIFGAPGYLASGATGAAIAPIAGTAIARGFNTLDTNQSLVGRAVNGADTGFGLNPSGQFNIRTEQPQEEMQAPTSTLTPDKIKILDEYFQKQGGNTVDMPTPPPAEIRPLEQPGTVQPNRFNGSTLNPIEQTIQLAATEQGLNPDLFKRIAIAESALKPAAKNTNSSATGLFQMTKAAAQDVGYNHRDMKNPVLNAAAAAQFTAKNIRHLKSILGREPSDGEVYAAHFMGRDGASKLFKNLGTGKIAARIAPAAAKSNRTIFFDGRRPRTVEEVFQVLNDKVAPKYQYVGYT